MRGVRIVLLWLIAMTVPLKGVSGNCMLGCGAAHRAMHATQTAAVLAESDTHAGNGHVHCAEARSPVPGAQPQASAPVHAPDIAASDASKPDCSACAPCCVAVAPVVEWPAMPQLQPQTDVVAQQDRPCDGIVADVLDRPPRLFPA